MKSFILEKAKHIIENRKYFAESEAFSNRDKALENEDFKKLYSKYVDLIIHMAKANTKESDQLNDLLAQIDKKLKELNIGKIKPDYYCKKCGDKGVIDGKYCDCLIDELNKILTTESGIPKLEDFDDVSFALFDNKDKTKLLYDKMKKWCHSSFDKNIVLISGQTGVGKTHLVRCMAKELIKLHKLVLFTSSFAMHQDFIKSHAYRDLKQKQDILNFYLDSEVLIIDDLGTEIRQPDITTNYLYQLINERKLKNLPTIITSNLNLSEINDYYDERIFSRIADKANSVCILMEGKDLRIKQDN